MFPPLCRPAAGGGGGSGAEPPAPPALGGRDPPPRALSRELEEQKISALNPKADAILKKILN